MVQLYLVNCDNSQFLDHLQSGHDKKFTCEHFKAQKLKIVEFASSVDPDMLAHNEQVIKISTVCSLVFEFPMSYRLHMF